MNAYDSIALPTLREYDAAPALHLVAVNEALHGAHAEVGQLHVKETATLLHL